MVGQGGGGWGETQLHSPQGSYGGGGGLMRWLAHSVQTDISPCPLCAPGGQTNAHCFCSGEALGGCWGPYFLNPPPHTLDKNINASLYFQASVLGKII